MTLRDEHSHPGKASVISSLQQMLEAVQDVPGEIGLLIELKADASHAEELAKAVVELVERYDFGRRAMSMSLSYGSVLPIQSAYPEWWVGCCVFGSTGNIDDTMWRYDIDFLAVEESMVSNRMVTGARECGLLIYVWSVNDDERMRQYIEMGVTGIITDWPETAREVLDRYRSTHDDIRCEWQRQDGPQRQPHGTEPEADGAETA